MSDTATAAAVFSPVLGVDDARWYLLEIEATMGDPRFLELQSSVEDAMMNFNLYDIGQYQVPVLFISGSCDWVCPADLVEEYAEENGLQYIAMEGCGHSPQGQHPDQFASIIRDFLHG